MGYTIFKFDWKMCSITIYEVGLFVCVKNFESNSYAMGNGWDKVGK